ncbi:unnamed protein product [Durusdinium trenchii]|uniref:Uncharacterized protein n=1 Tax=Durusdinium trenchii TaxID=1381693 RepID=A0ABP0KC23_9DINO
MFPILVLLAFMADKGWFSRDKSTPVMTKGKTTKLFDDMTLEELQKAEMKLQKEYGMELSDEEVAKLLAKDIDKHKSKAAYRVGATHALFGGKRVPGVGEKAPVPPVALKSVVPTAACKVAQHSSGPPTTKPPLNSSPRTWPCLRASAR